MSQEFNNFTLYLVFVNLLGLRSCSITLHTIYKTRDHLSPVTITQRREGRSHARGGKRLRESRITWKSYRMHHGHWTITFCHDSKPTSTTAFKLPHPLHMLSFISSSSRLHFPPFCDFATHQPITSFSDLWTTEMSSLSRALRIAGTFTWVCIYPYVSCRVKDPNQSLTFVHLISHPTPYFGYGFPPLHLPLIQLL